MALDRYPDVDRDVDDGEYETTELAVTDDLLVKAFVLGPGAELPAHEHAEQTNVFHVLEGEVVVVQGGAEQTVDAPGVVVHERGLAHGARNETDDVAVFTATMGPMG